MSTNAWPKRSKPSGTTPFENGTLLNVVVLSFFVLFDLLELPCLVFLFRMVFCPVFICPFSFFFLCLLEFRSPRGYSFSICLAKVRYGVVRHHRADVLGHCATRWRWRWRHYQQQSQ